MRAVVVCAFVALATGARSTPPSPEVANVAAFARLYGAARFFYPSDGAAGLDWDRFAVLGVARVRTAPDATALVTTLRDLFEPLGPGFVVARELPTPEPATGGAGPLVAWQYLGPGFGGGGGPYQVRRINRPVDPSIDGFVTVMQTVPADGLRGSEIRMRGRARARVGGDGWGALWLRVDRANREMGFFDNMGDRQIREGDWKEYVIQGPVAEDAAQVAFGMMASGAATADFDAIELQTHTSDGEWQPVPVEDPGFEADPDGTPWFRTGSSGNARVERVAEGAPEGRQMLRLAPPDGGIPPPLLEGTLPEAGAHVDVDLGQGLRARVPIALSDADAGADTPALRELTLALETQPRSGPDIDTRLADIVVAWNVFRHFYPYWDETGVDWDVELTPSLADALGAPEAHRDVLRRLVARARDGHGRVGLSEAEERSRGSLPLRLCALGARVVVTASAVPEQVPVGAVVRSIGAEPAESLLEQAVGLASGSEQWRRVSAMWELESGPRDAPVTLEVGDSAGVRSVTLRYTSREEIPEPRPEPVAELGDGLLYVDLTRARMADLRPELERLAAAPGVVFDVRGYPTDAGFGILPYLIDSPESTRWMHVARVDAPFGRWAGWNDMGWDLKPAEPRVAARRVFITDARAISYAESVMGYVADLGLGTIVGAPTAGTNGNVKRVVLPTAAWINFTGMKVTRHDGESAHHLVGIQPDVALEPTIEGIRAGRDELLARAIELLREGA